MHIHEGPVSLPTHMEQSTGSPSMRFSFLLLSQCSERDATPSFCNQGIWDSKVFFFLIVPLSVIWETRIAQSQTEPRAFARIISSVLQTEERHFLFHTFNSTFLYQDFYKLYKLICKLFLEIISPITESNLFQWHKKNIAWPSNEMEKAERNYWGLQSVYA